MRRGIAGCVLGLAGLLAVGPAALAADPAGKPTAGKAEPAQPAGIDRVPGCDADAVLRTVTARTELALKRKNADGPTLKELGPGKEAAFIELPDGLIGRRFCHATVTLSTGKSTEAFYVVEELMSFASAPWPRGTGWAMRWGMDVCVAGTDIWHIYDGDCRTMRPPAAM